MCPSAKKRSREPIQPMESGETEQIGSLYVFALTQRIVPSSQNNYCNVRFCSLADIPPTPFDVCFEGRADPHACVVAMSADDHRNKIIFARYCFVRTATMTTRQVMSFKVLILQILMAQSRRF